MSLNNWEVKKIEKLFDIGRGRVISENEINSNLGDYPVYSSQTANKGEFGRVSFYEFEGEYITWTTDGANAGTVFYRNGRFNCTNVCGTLKAKHINEIHTLFFSYLIDREAFKHVAVVGNNKLMNNVMGKIKLSYPKNYSEQKTIAAILSKVDEAIAAVEDSIKAAEKVKKALMQNLLTGKLKPDGTWRSDDEFYTDEKFGKIPKNWKTYQVGDITENFDSQRKPIKAEDRKDISGSYPYYGAAGIIDWVNDYLFDGEYILFGEDGNNLLSRNLPQAFIVKGKFWANNHAHIIKALPEYITNEFLCEQLYLTRS
jgi:type I restriction enzyme S subunit